jgi:sortilin-related receptor
LFGSAPSEHSWLIIKADLRNAFSANCTEDDYNFWAPGFADDDVFTPCVMGYKETYQRRRAHASCYNGVGYQRPIRQEICQCTAWDFECDYGFSRLNRNAGCIRNKTMARFDPYAIPTTCKPGAFYDRTKGYRKIEADACIDGFATQFLPQKIACPFEKTTSEFLVIAQRDKISRIDLADGKKEEFPVTGLKNVIAVDFDMKHNCVFWADIILDIIGRQCLNGNQSAEVLVETGLASVEGMSYDWISEMLYFVDGVRIKIEAVKTTNDSFGEYS